MNLLRIFRPFALPFLLAISVNQALEGQAPPCRPCGGIVVSNPLAAARALEAKPLLEGEARLYVAWDVELEEAARAAEASTAVAKAGGTPWIRMIFRTASPLLANADTLSQELAAAAKLAGAAAEKTHFQILWEPATAHSQKSDLNPEEYAYLFKRVSVAVTGARTQARVITAALPPAVGFLNTFYGEGTAAYVDGLALRPATEEVLAAGIARAAELDPGRPVVLDAAPWPEDPWLLLADAARWTEAGASLVFFSAESASHIDGQTLLPLKLLAREFQGDLSLDPYSKPTGAAEAWSFVRGEDLSLRIIVRAAADAENLDLLFPDRQLKKPTRIDPTTGIAEDLFGQTRTADGLRIRLPVRDKVTLLTLDRMSAEEIEGLEEELTVTDQRQMPVEEILRRLQAFDDSQARRLQHYRALNTTHMRFQFGTGAQGLEATFEGDFFFKQGQGFDWAWQRFYINGVRWRGKNLPEIPLIQAEKAAALPLEIHFTKEYSYRLRGTETVDGRDCWVVDFSPDVKPEPGRTLYRGSVWIDQEFFGRVRTRALQLGLEGDVISNEETIFYSPLTLQGEPGDWTPVDLWLPLRVVGQQLGGPALAHDAAAFHHIGAVRDLQRRIGVLLGQQHGGAGRVDALYGLEHLLDDQGRQAQRGLVQQQGLGPAHHGAADGHHLLLAARQRAGRVVLLLAQDGKQLHHLLQRLLAGTGVAAVHIGAQLQVAQHRHLGEQLASFGALHHAGLHDGRRLAPGQLLPVPDD